jgi:hypothetical protein
MYQFAGHCKAEQGLVLNVPIETNKEKSVGIDNKHVLLLAGFEMGKEIECEISHNKENFKGVCHQRGHGMSRRHSLSPQV